MAADVRPLPGPVPSVMPPGYDLADLGYLEEEFLLAGDATAFRTVGERTPDGRWAAEPDPATTTPYRTRLLVRRPADPTAFSGTVLVEWLNVTGGVDAAPDWMYMHRHLHRRGDAWVGVSAQKAGIDGGGLVEGPHLKQFAPERYADLLHPGDAWSFDIFSQAGAAVRTGAPLGPRHAERVVASGVSQSAVYLTTYVNAVDPLAAVYDGFLVHSRGAAGARLDPPAPGEDVPAVVAAIGGPGEAIRADLRVPVMVLQSETDVYVLGAGRAGQTDGDRLRLWEIAGTSHADTYLLMTSHTDDGHRPAEQLARQLRPVSEIMGVPTSAPINAGPQQHYVAQAAWEHLVRWAGGGEAPPAAPRLDRNDAGDGFALDADGLATGGVRTPWVDVPTAVLSGLGQTGEAFSFLFGTTFPLAEGRLAERYPGGRDHYLARFAAALDATVAAGFVLAADRDEILAVAAASWDQDAAG